MAAAKVLLCPMEAWEPWAVEAASPALVRGERVLASQRGVGLYAGDTKVAERSAGTAMLTTHRLAYVDDARPRERSAYVRLACIRQSEYYAGFLKSSPKIVLVCLREAHVPWTCHVCGTFHDTMTLDRRCRLCGVTVRHAPTQRACPVCTYVNGENTLRCEMCTASLDATATTTCKLSFRHGGERPFYATLRDTLQSKPWIATETKSRPGLLAVEAASAVEAPPLDALADLDMLMRQARRMVDFAESLRTELERYERTAPSSGPASSLLQSALVRIGLPSPAVTPDMVKNERAYHRELARELSGVLLGEHGLLGPCDQDTGRGLLPLDEVWGLWNRARGVALVSPKLLRAAVTYLPDMTSPSVRLRTLRSGMPILYTPRFDDAAIEERVLRYLDEAPFLTTTQIAALEGLSAPLMRELLEGVEQQTGAVVRDECGAKETRWCRNRMATMAAGPRRSSCTVP